jgi:hypothetical protein
MNERSANAQRDHTHDAEVRHHADLLVDVDLDAA